MASSRTEDARMPRKRHTAEGIVAKLRQVDVLTGQGRPVAEAVRAIGVTGVTYARRLARRGDLLLLREDLSDLAPLSFYETRY
jgi:putative transposase